jgi:hypothetical protein
LGNVVFLILYENSSIKVVFLCSRILSFITKSQHCDSSVIQTEEGVVSTAGVFCPCMGLIQPTMAAFQYIEMNQGTLATSQHGSGGGFQQQALESPSHLKYNLNHERSVLSPG